MLGKTSVAREEPARTIIAFSACDSSNNDGYIGHTAMVIELLREQDFRVHVYGFCSGEPRIPGGSFVRRRHEALGGIEAALRFCLRILFGAGVDAIVLTSAGALWNPLFATLAQVRKTPVIYDCQDPSIEAIRWRYRSRPWFPIVESYLRWGQRRLDTATVMTLSVSPGVDGILRSGGWKGKIQRLYNIHNAIDHSSDGDRKKAQSSLRSQFDFPTATVLLYVGGVQSTYRGLEEQLEAVRLCVSNGTNVVMAILYGSGNPAFIFETAGDLLRLGRLKLFQNVSPDNVRAYIRDGDVAVSATLSYALPSKIFEYVADGLEVYCAPSDEDIRSELRSYIIEFDGSVEGICRAISASNNDETERSKRRLRGRALIASLEEKNARVFALLKAELIERHRLGP